MKEDFVSRQQLNLLPERIRKAQETDAGKELNAYLSNLYEKNESNPMIGNAFYAEAGTFGSVWKTGESAGSAYTEDVILGFPLGE